MKKSRRYEMADIEAAMIYASWKKQDAKVNFLLYKFPHMTPEIAAKIQSQSSWHDGSYRKGVSVEEWLWRHSRHLAGFKTSTTAEAKDAWWNWISSQDFPTPIGPPGWYDDGSLQWVHR